jgi:hypothetical protein
MVGVVSALALAAVHLAEMPEEFEEAPYLGVLFALGGLALIGAAVGLMRQSMNRIAWMTGALVAVGMFVGYALSRTVGLPGLEIEEWGEPLGVLSLVLEVVLVAAAAVALLSSSKRRTAVER